MSELFPIPETEPSALEIARQRYFTALELEGMSTMVSRFQRWRWSPVRKAIAGMPPESRKTFNPSEYFNCKSSVDRLNDAYEGDRRWEVSGWPKGKRITVRRTR